MHKHAKCTQQPRRLTAEIIHIILWTVDAQPVENRNRKNNPHKPDKFSTTG